MKSSIYVCHTYYHVYVSMLKEMAKDVSEQGKATVVLSTMSTDFENFADRLRSTGYFKEILIYEEKNRDEIPGIKKYVDSTCGPIKKIINRIKFTKEMAKAQIPYVPTDFSKYDEVYVFCDSDPIGYYLNYKHIYYHAVEDGLDTIRNWDLARADNVGFFGLKVFLSKRLNLLFIQNGYGKYCIDMEVNNISILKYPCPYYIEVSRAKLTERLTENDKAILLKAFVKSEEKIRETFKNKESKKLLILTEPLSSLDVRERIIKDLIETYGKGYEVIIKQHPRDYMDYEKLFPQYLLVDRTVPMEMLNFFSEIHVDLVVSVFTELGNIFFADEKIRLGRDFMDAYEDKAIHAARFESD